MTCVKFLYLLDLTLAMMITTCSLLLKLRRNFHAVLLLLMMKKLFSIEVAVDKKKTKIANPLCSGIFACSTESLPTVAVEDIGVIENYEGNASQGRVCVMIPLRGCCGSDRFVWLRTQLNNNGGVSKWVDHRMENCDFTSTKAKGSPNCSSEQRQAATRCHVSRYPNFDLCIRVATKHGF